MTLGHVEVFWGDDSTTAAAVIPSVGEKHKGRFDTVDEGIFGSYAFSQLCQVMDSPGLLVRPDHKRNEMEALTLAAMQHLPTAVIYVSSWFISALIFNISLAFINSIFADLSVIIFKR